MLPASTASVRPDGSYSLVVLPGPGLIGVVASPREDYAVADVMHKQWAGLWQSVIASRRPSDMPSDLEPCVPVASETGRPGQLAISKYHALALTNPPDKARTWGLNLSLQTAQTLQGKVLGPDGQPLNGVKVVGLTALRDGEMLEGASFTVTGLNAHGARVLFFQHHGKKLGKVVTVRANMPQPVTVKLEPCGTVKGRLVDGRGKPMPGVPVLLGEDASPGYETTQTDQGGRFQIAVFAGQNYSWGLSPRLLSKGLLTVQVGAGQVHDLGDLKVAR
jgi:hypothetical protein